MTHLTLLHLLAPGEPRVFAFLTTGTPHRVWQRAGEIREEAP